MAKIAEILNNVVSDSGVEISSLQPLLTNPVTGTGTTNYIPKFTGTSAIGNSDLITDGSGNLAIAQGNAPTQALNIYRAGSTQTVMAAGNSNTGLNGTYFGVDPNGNGIFNTTGAFANIFSTNGSERMRITSGGDVGIGTTAPSYKLDVQEVIRSKYGSNEGRLYLGGTPAGVAYVAGAVRAAPSPSYSYTGKLSFYTTTWGVGSDYGITEQMYIDTTAADTKASTLVMLPWGGSVGLGTTTPSSILDARVSSGATSGFRFKGWSDSATPYLLSLGTQTYQDIFQIKSVNGLVTMGIVGAVGATPDLAFQTNSTERMRITSAGNVGIGTTSPEAKLDVFGSSSDQIRLRTAASEYYRIGRNASTGYLDFWGSQSGYVGYTWSGVNGERMRLDSSGNLGLGVVPSAWSTAGPALQLKGTALVNYADNYASSFSTNAYYNTSNQWAYYSSTYRATLYQQADGSHTWNTVASGTANAVISWTQAMTLDASGRLGIGTTSPDVYGVHAYNASNSVYFKSVSGSTTTLYGSATALGVGLLGTFSNSDLTIYTNSSEKMRITSGGNVGIGTSSPANKLQIGSVGSTGFGGNDIAIGNGSQVMTFYQSATISTWYTNTSFSLMPSGVGSVGNVGIGTPTPAYKLDVLGSFNFTTGGNNLTYNSGVLYHGNYYQFPSANDYALFARTSGALIFGANDTERMRITSGGIVGIGTSSPDASTMLQVQTSNSCSVRIVSSAASGGDLYLTSVNSGSESRIDKQGTAGPLTFYNNGSERMRITSSGNTELSGSIKTGTPSGGTAVPWKLGSRITNSCGLPGTYADFASSFMVSNKVIEVEIDGVLVYIPIVNPGWC